MGRVFLGNFDFEHRLAGVGRKNAGAIAAELSFAWLAVADPADHVCGLAPLTTEVAGELEAIGHVPPSGPLNAGTTLVPWGWDSYARQFAAEHELACVAPSAASVERVNSREFSFGLEQDLGCGLPGATRATSRGEFYAATVDLPSWVAKAEFGMSSRERLIGRHSPNAAQLAWLDKRLGEGQAVYVEPWVEIVEESGTQFEVSESGDVKLIGTTGLLTTSKGAFAGCWLQANVEREWLDESIVEAVAAAAAKLGYFGPIGVDSALCSIGEELVARPIQDVNGRYTMGRLALGWLDTIPSNGQAAWLFLPGIDASAAERIRNTLGRFHAVQTTRTSADNIDRPGLSAWLLTSDDSTVLREACRAVFSTVGRRLRL